MAGGEWQGFVPQEFCFIGSRGRNRPRALQLRAIDTPREEPTWTYLRRVPGGWLSHPQLDRLTTNPNTHRHKKKGPKAPNHKESAKRIYRALFHNELRIGLHSTLGEIDPIVFLFL